MRSPRLSLMMRSIDSFKGWKVDRIVAAFDIVGEKSDYGRSHNATDDEVYEGPGFAHPAPPVRRLAALAHLEWQGQECQAQHRRGPLPIPSSQDAMAAAPTGPAPPRPMPTWFAGGPGAGTGRALTAMTGRLNEAG
jgi:hypothetical protein